MVSLDLGLRMVFEFDSVVPYGDGYGDVQRLRGSDVDGELVNAARDDH